MGFPSAQSNEERHFRLSDKNFFRPLFLNGFPLFRGTLFASIAPMSFLL
jgi:hypothetical protein